MDIKESWIGTPAEVSQLPEPVRQYVRRIEIELDDLRAKTAFKVGVGDGSGSLFVHGDYDSVKAVQTIVIEGEKARAELVRAKATATRRAPCEHLCEARAFEIEIRQLKAEVQQLRAYKAECDKAEPAVSVPDGWHIELNPKPIPDRSHDYDFWHDDYDGADGGNGLCGTAKSIEDAKAQIAHYMQCSWCLKHSIEFDVIEGITFCSSKCESDYYSDGKARAKDNRKPLWMERRDAAMLSAAPTNSRSPQDYAIEHAEYMAVNGEHLIEYLNEISDVDEGALAPDDRFGDYVSGLRSGIYEFRKRAARCQVLESPAPEKQTRSHLPEGVTRVVNAATGQAKAVPDSEGDK